ncbi:phage tail assembly protein T [Streptomyces chartreusis]|uniref:phage tail assembly protein T n=1 Tax=Streptomyces chartreusis TaxID=1969 RepID=UPI0038125067
MAELDSQLDSYELTEWMVIEKMTGPLGRRRGDIQAATIAAAIANANRGKGGRKFKVTDFLIPYGEAARKTPEQMLAAVKDINRSLGGVEHGRKPDS